MCASVSESTLLCVFRYAQPVFVYIPPHGELRGGAWVVVDTTINAQYMEMYAADNARGGVLGRFLYGETVILMLLCVVVYVVVAWLLRGCCGCCLRGCCGCCFVVV